MEFVNFVLQYYYNNKFPRGKKQMAFVARQNRQSNPNQATNFSYGRVAPSHLEQSQMQKKVNEQELYKQELQRQIMEKEERKKKQLEKIRREDEKFMRQIQEMNRKQREKKQAEKQRKEKAFENNQSNSSPKLKKELSGRDYKASRVKVGSLNIGLRQHQDNLISNQPQIPRLGFDQSRVYNYEPPVYTQPHTALQRRRPYMFDDYEPANQYYEQRIRRHKQHMNQKLDELFQHIHSTKDNIRADQQIEKIKRRLRAKQTFNEEGGYGTDSQVQMEYQNKFYYIPKKNYNYESSRSPKQGKSRVLDYQSTSKFTMYDKANSNRATQQSRYRARAQSNYDDMYSLPDSEYSGKKNRGRENSNENKGIGNREALDLQIAKTLGDIDQFQGYLKKIEND